MLANDARAMIGIDLGLDKSVARGFRDDTGELAFRTLPTEPARTRSRLGAPKAIAATAHRLARIVSNRTR